MARLSHFHLFLMTLGVVVASVSSSSSSPAATANDAAGAPADAAGDQDSIGNEDGDLSPSDGPALSGDVVEGPLGSGSGASVDDAAAASPGRSANASSASPMTISVVAGVSVMAGLTAILY